METFSIAQVAARTSIAALQEPVWRKRILGEDDVRRIIALETDLRNRVLLLLLYGLRRGSVHLRGRNVTARGDTGQLTVYGKGGKTRAALLPAAMWKDLNTLNDG